jgi:hypothetical protein
LKNKISDQVPLVIGYYAKPPQSKLSFPPRGKKIGMVGLLLPGEEALEIQELSDQILETLPSAEELLLLYCEN